MPPTAPPRSHEAPPLILGSINIFLLFVAYGFVRASLVYTLFGIEENGRQAIIGIRLPGDSPALRALSRLTFILLSFIALNPFSRPLASRRR